MLNIALLFLALVETVCPQSRPILEAEQPYNWVLPVKHIRIWDYARGFIEITWDSPSVVQQYPYLKSYITHYLVTIGPYNIYTGRLESAKGFIVFEPRMILNIGNMEHMAAYRIIVQACTDKLIGRKASIDFTKSHLLKRH